MVAEVIDLAAAVDAERKLAEFAAQIQWDDLPPHVQRRALLVAADCAASAAGGLAVERNLRLAETIAKGALGSASVIGLATGVEPGYAALIHGTAGTELELDEGHRFSAGHPGIHVVPAAMALAEATGASGPGFLAAVVAGYEVAARVGEAMQPLAPEWHPHGVWGGAGAAAACGKLLGLPPHQLVQAVRIAANYALNTRYETALEGATVRQSYAGVAGMMGLIAARMAAAGFSGLDGGVVRGLSTYGTPLRATRLLPPSSVEDVAVMHNYFKVHSACRHLHGMLDALDELSAETGPFSVHEVEAVVVETYGAAARFDNPAPRNALQARFSVPFGVATRLLRGHAHPAAFSDAAIDEPTLMLARRVSVREANEFTAAAPKRRPTQVTIRLRDGRTFTKRVDLPRGDSERPFSEGELWEKFHRLMSSVLGEEGAERGREGMESLPLVADVGVVFRRLRGVDS